MKHLIACAVISICCGILQAGQIAWGNTDIGVITNSPSGGNLADYTAYLCVGSMSDVESTVASLQAGTWDSTTSVDSKNLTYDESLGGGYLNGENATELSPSVTEGEHSFYVVLLDSTGTYFMVSDCMTGDVLDLSVDIGRADQILWDVANMSVGSGGDGWLQVGGTVDPGVPEPTALALLALGVAGVALRRRVA